MNKEINMEKERDLKKEKTEELLIEIIAKLQIKRDYFRDVGWDASAYHLDEIIELYKQ